MTLQMTIGAWWGGLPCALALEGGGPLPCVYRRTRGVDPTPSEVAFPRSMFTVGLAPEFDPKRFEPREDGPPLDLIRLLDAPRPAPTAGRPPYVADLWMVQGTGSEQRRLRARALYFDQAVIANPQADDPVVVVTLSDIRKWWARHGAITRSWNVRLPRETQRGSGVLGGQRYQARTAKADGREPVPMREIVQELLRALPGALDLVRWPAGVGEGADAPQVVCRAARPKEALRGLLDAYRLHLDVGPDFVARVFRAGEGLVGDLVSEAADNTDSYDPEAKAGAWATEITADGDRYARRATGAPRDVLVVGDMTIFDTRQDLCLPVLTYTAEAEGQTPETVVLEVTPDNLDALGRGNLQPEGLVGIPDTSGVLPDALDRHALNVILGVPAPPLPKVVRIPRAPRNLAGSATSEAGFLVTPTGLAFAPENPGGAGRSFAPLQPGETRALKEVPQRQPEPLSPVQLAENDPAAPRATSGDPFVWQRIPVLDDDAWERTFEWLPTTTRKVIREQLWRYYQIPLTRYAPILERAERDGKGDRLAFQVYAFTFRAVRVRQPRRRETDEDLQRAADVALLAATRKQIARLEVEIELLRDPDIIEALALVTAPFSGMKPEDITASGRADVTPADVQRGASRLQELASSWLPTLLNLAAVSPSVSAFLARVPEQERATIIRGLVGVGRTREAVQALIEQKTALLEDDRKSAAELNRKLYPKAQREIDLGVIEGEIRAAREATGEDPPDLVAKRDALILQVDAQAAEDKRKALSDARPDWEERYRIENLTRHPVPARLVDKARGIFEVLGDDLPCWAADTLVKHLGATYLIPMPVAIEFGSTCADSLTGLADDEDTLTNPYLLAAREMLKKAPPEAQPLIGRIGHVLPLDGGQRPYGERHVELGYVRGGKADGTDVVGATPWVEVLDEAKPFRELRRLDGTSNRSELAERAAAIASALLGVPEDTDAGALVVVGPRTVGANGRISAVETRLAPADGSGITFLTEVAFDGDEAPLPDVAGRTREDGAMALSFGIDTEATVDR